jgi:predicted amidophosphoribosyltransferase
MIESVAFASCYVYSPSGTGTVCERSRMLRALLKRGDARFLVKYAHRVQQQAAYSTHLAGFFLADDVLVPVPGSSPKSCGLWVAASLADALLREGLGALAWPGLRRICAVRKSATAAPGARPTVDAHYASFLMGSPPHELRSVILVDDVITKGRTLLAAAARVREALPGAQIRAFALLRTMGMTPSVGQLLNPCRGEITWTGGDARRTP